MKRGLFILIYLIVFNLLSETKAQTLQNKGYSYGLMPSNRSAADASSAYNTWKTNFVASCSNGRYRVKFDNQSQTVSEGIGYGMLLAAYASDRTLFDGLWNYYKDNRNGNGVMNWKINGCSGVAGANGATDADEDAAMALIVAHNVWGSSGSINYQNDAKALIAAIKSKEVESGTFVLKPGDVFGGSSNTNPSYFAPGYYRTFGAFTNDASFWNSVASKTYSVINNNLSAHNAVGGLVSDWCQASGAYSQGQNYSYDACRTPWRIAVDYVWYGTSDAKTYSKKSSEFVRVNLGGSKNVKDGYSQNGSATGQWHNSPFVGGFASAAMGGDNQTHLDNSYSDLKGINDASSYFNQTLKTLYLFLLTGNFYLPGGGTVTPPPPPSVTETPFSGTAMPIPGRVEVEKYDNGGNGLAYSDATSGNSGGQLRTDDVDVETTADAGGGYDIGWTAAGEWLKYAVNVSATGKYDFKVRVASINSGKSFHIEMNGSNVTGSIAIPNTGGWQTWQTVTVSGVSLNSGSQYMRIYFDTDGFNINYVDVSSATSTNVAPVVSVTSPANNSSFNAGGNITITANATDSDGSIAKVDFYRGTTLLGSSGTSPYSFTWNNVAAGSYSITAKATDNSGAVTTSAGVNIVVNTVTGNVAPSVTITSPANNSSFNAGANITFTANATDSDGSINKVDYYQGTTFLGSSTTSPYSFTWNNVAAGSYSITAKATDNAGAVTTSATINITVNTVVVGNVAPSVTITSPANNATFTSGANITITANATDSDGSIVKVEFYQGTALLGSAATSPYNFTWSNVAAGTYSLTAKATDNGGAVKTSAAVSITVNSVSTGGNCTTEATPLAADWIVRNDWADQNNGSVVINESGALKFSHRQWGEAFAWLIEANKTFSIVSGRTYTIKFDFMDDPSNHISSVNVGLASGWDWAGPTLVQPDVTVPSGYSSTAFTTKTVTITATSTQSVHLALKLVLGAQPNLAVNDYIKNISICESGTMRTTVNASASGAVSGSMLYPNPFEGSAKVLINSSETVPLKLKISLQSGVVIFESEGYSTNEEVEIGNDFGPGIYILQGYYSDKVFTSKLVKY
jgi:endo-1,4-beta-D-glucanase Y